MAIQEQLGLRLKSARSDFDVLVIDSVERVRLGRRTSQRQSREVKP